MTPRDSESVLNRLSRLEREATPGPWEQDGLADVFQVDDDGGAIVAAHYDADAALIVLSRNHLRALLDVARAADGFRHLSLPNPAHFERWKILMQALAPLLTTPSEQNLKGVEEGSA